MKINKFVYMSFLTALSVNGNELNLDDKDIETLNHIATNPEEVTKLVLKDNDDIKDFSKLKEFKNLKELDLSDCDLDKIPEEISSLTNLEVLDLSDNDDIEDYSILAKLPNLKTLYLRDCKLKKIPDILSEIKTLKNLDISGNSKLDPSSVQSFIDKKRNISVTQSSFYSKIEKSVGNIEDYIEKMEDRFYD